jgi:hypothetical protein
MSSLIEARPVSIRTPRRSPASHVQGWQSMLATLIGLLTITFAVQIGSQNLLGSVSEPHAVQAQDVATVFAQFPGRPH